MKRAKLTLSDKVAILSRQARCCRCGELLGADIEWDHNVPLAMGGMDDPVNISAIHKRCHAEKTNGRPATSYGSDKHAIAKIRRLRRKHPTLGELNAELAKLFPPRVVAKFPKRKIPSRPLGRKKRAALKEKSND